jgi:hypothetical protein
MLDSHPSLFKNKLHFYQLAIALPKNRSSMQARFLLMPLCYVDFKKPLM